MSSMEYTRQCDKCKKFKSCSMSFFTERLWFCKDCSVTEVGAESIKKLKESMYDIEAVLGPPNKMDAVDGPTCSCGKPSSYESGWCGSCYSKQDLLLSISASKEELIDISRAIMKALEFGSCDVDSGNKQIIIKVKK